MIDRSTIADAIVTKATERGPEKSTCPSEVARAIFPDNWREHMQEIRNVAIDLCKEGSIIITQKGKDVDVTNFKGPVRIKVKRQYKPETDF
ncbi:DUF3253 domain-containing protein [Mucilaginibacter auburnensis]|uniref:Uncharacterized protein DUF3253 n=1 Tax=Mucilaginibacter auburnensis TaxID=1457233 RepID=A0A2H9VW55_9SPHI|nr:DUF3253 domain-containing protein [Mucilaginibacter auburnensis]PJJ85054.1 uncharacterized protein DUF3253 [Mucilaginibacter auburnensis]